MNWDKKCLVHLYSYIYTSEIQQLTCEFNLIIQQVYKTKYLTV